MFLYVYIFNYSTNYCLIIQLLDCLIVLLFYCFIVRGGSLDARSVLENESGAKWTDFEPKGHQKEAKSINNVAKSVARVRARKEKVSKTHQT